MLNEKCLETIFSLLRLNQELISCNKKKFINNFLHFSDNFRRFSVLIDDSVFVRIVCQFDKRIRAASCEEGENRTGCHRQRKALDNESVVATKYECIKSQHKLNMLRRSGREGMIFQVDQRSPIFYISRDQNILMDVIVRCSHTFCSLNKWQLYFFGQITQFCLPSLAINTYSLPFPAPDENK